MIDFFSGIFAQIFADTTAVGSIVSMDSLLPLGAVVAGVAVGVIQIYNSTRDRAYGVQYDAIEARLVECERYRDSERAKLEACRSALSEAHLRIADLERMYERRMDAGSQSRKSE